MSLQQCYYKWSVCILNPSVSSTVLLKVIRVLRVHFKSNGISSKVSVSENFYLFIKNYYSLIILQNIRYLLLKYSTSTKFFFCVFCCSPKKTSKKSKSNKKSTLQTLLILLTGTFVNVSVLLSYHVFRYCVIQEYTYTMITLQFF